MLVAMAATALVLRLFALLAAWQVDDLGADSGRDCLQLRPANARLEYLQVRALDGDDGKTRPACATPGMTSLAHKNLAHQKLLSGTLRRAIVM